MLEADTPENVWRSQISVHDRALMHISHSCGYIQRLKKNKEEKNWNKNKTKKEDPITYDSIT